MGTNVAAGEQRQLIIEDAQDPPSRSRYGTIQRWKGSHRLPHHGGCYSGFPLGGSQSFDARGIAVEGGEEKIKEFAQFMKKCVWRSCFQASYL